MNAHVTKPVHGLSYVLRMMPEMSSAPVPTPPSIARLLRVYGRVQGVYYRVSMVEQAQQLRATGWVRNRADGTVEALVQGPPEVVQALTDWAQGGPPAAQVDRVESAHAPLQPLSGFAQVATL